jgi:hypothetical protein
VVRARRAHPAGDASSQRCAWTVRNRNTAREEGTYRALLRRLLPRSAVSQRGEEKQLQPQWRPAGATLRRRRQLFRVEWGLGLGWCGAIGAVSLPAKVPDLARPGVALRSGSATGAGYALGVLRIEPLRVSTLRA